MMKSNKQLTFDIKPVNRTTVQLFSWVVGDKTATFYFHGEFESTGEIVESVAMRKKDLGIAAELGEYTI